VQEAQSEALESGRGMLGSQVVAGTRVVGGSKCGREVQVGGLMRDCAAGWWFWGWWWTGWGHIVGRSSGARHERLVQSHKRAGSNLWGWIVCVPHGCPVISGAWGQAIGRVASCRAGGLGQNFVHSRLQNGYCLFNGIQGEMHGFMHKRAVCAPTCTPDCETTAGSWGYPCCLNELVDIAAACM